MSTVRDPSMRTDVHARLNLTLEFSRLGTDARGHMSATAITIVARPFSYWVQVETTAARAASYNDNVLEVEFDLSLTLLGTITGTCDVVAEGSLNWLAE